MRFDFRMTRPAVIAIVVFLAMIWNVMAVEASSRKPLEAPTTAAVDSTRPVAQAPVAATVSDDGLTNTANGVVQVIDDAGGSVVNRDGAVVILGILLLVIYRVLQWAAGRMKTPVGTMWLNILAKGIALLFGTEAAWKNRVVVSGATAEFERAEKQRLIDKLYKDHPMIRKLLDRIRS